MGKSTINGPFSIAMLNYQRVHKSMEMSWDFPCRCRSLVFGSHMVGPHQKSWLTTVPISKSTRNHWWLFSSLAMKEWKNWAQQGKDIRRHIAADGFLSWFTLHIFDAPPPSSSLCGSKMKLRESRSIRKFPTIQIMLMGGIPIFRWLILGKKSHIIVVPVIKWPFMGILHFQTHPHQEII